MSTQRLSTQRLNTSRRTLRYAVPVAVMASTFAITSLSRVMSADAQTPNLPSITPAELLAKVSAAQIPAFSGTVTMTANLGLPDLGGLGGDRVPSSAIQLLIGTHTANISADGPEKVKITMAGEAAESSWIRNGNEAWSWDSSNQSVKHLKKVKDQNATSTDDPREPNTSDAPAEQLNPATVASNLLASVDASTTVSVRTTAYVAGRAAYELVLTPKSTNSTISEVVLSVDAATGTPLETRIMAKGVTKPAIDVGFTTINFATPPASTFVFVPPKGATVTEVSSLSELLPISGPRHHHDDGANKEQQTPGGTPDATAPDAPSSGGTMTTIGTGWDSVAVLTASPQASQINSLMGAAKEVKLANGSTARLLSTRLVNVLVAADGRMAVGAVNQAGLEAALAQPAAAA
jgi:outer membrane lipoprotein-sorting protein